MAKIKGWKKYDDYGWESENKKYLVRVLSYKGDGQWQVFVSEEGGYFGNIYGKSFNTKKEARKMATNYMRANPDG